MPTRTDIFVNGGVYHIFNKTIEKKLVFDNDLTVKKFFEILTYYRSSRTTIRYSHFLGLENDVKESLLRKLFDDKYYYVDILSYCLMPNHFHILLKQKIEKGILKFMSNIINSFTRYYNIKYERIGPLFIPQFRSRTIRSTEQFIHVCRYIHLNPYSSGLVNNIEELINFKHSSLREYLNIKKSYICRKDLILKEFKNIESFKKFTIQNAEYQKTLEHCKYTEKWI